MEMALLKLIYVRIKNLEMVLIYMLIKYGNGLVEPDEIQA